MTPRDPLQCTFDDARRVHLRQGITLSTRAKVDFFEEMVAFAVSFGARDRLADRQSGERNAASPPGTSATSVGGEYRRNM